MRLKCKRCRSKIEDSYQRYYAEAQKKYIKVPNVKGMSGMDAVSILRKSWD